MTMKTDTVTATRDKRSTAGKRMSHLVGEAQDADDAFWGHDTWAEDDSGNESFRESDEDSEVRKDQFDSDFDESEEDFSDAEAAAGRDEEVNLRQQEKLESRKKTFDVAKAGRDLLQKKKGAKGRMKGQRIFGDGDNAGLVLNMPNAAQPLLRVQKVGPTPTTKITLASTRLRRNRSKSLRTTTQLKSTTELPPKPSKKGTSTKKSRAQYWTQEQLLLEAATVTEPENERWLLGRKRLHEQAEAVMKLQDSQQRNGKLISKYRSRRGMLTTLTFSEMDAVPEILVQIGGAPPRPRPVYCAITGRRANYKCPKTGKGYYDMMAFKELRRRLEAGEALDQRKHKQEELHLLQVDKNERSLIDKASSVISSPFAISSTTERTITMAQQSVESPSRSITMTTRMATKFPMKHNVPEQISTYTLPPTLPVVESSTIPMEKTAQNNPKTSAQIVTPFSMLLDNPFAAAAALAASLAEESMKLAEKRK